jgi:hypothetical protein
MRSLDNKLKISDNPSTTHQLMFCAGKSVIAEFTTIVVVICLLILPVIFLANSRPVLETVLLNPTLPTRRYQYQETTKASARSPRVSGRLHITTMVAAAGYFSVVEGGGDGMTYPR